MAIQVVLDTNIYRNNPARDSAHFQSFAKLAAAGRVVLHIPYVVEREFQTQQREIYAKDFEKAVSGLASLSRRALTPALAKSILDARNLLKESEQNILSDAEAQFLIWATGLGSARIPLTTAQASAAMEAYFQGAPPLKSVKNREDIPDSFIVQAIKEVIKQYGVVHVVAGDKKILDSFKEVASSPVYASLADFIESPAIQHELKELDLVENLEEIKNAIANTEEVVGEISNFISLTIGEAIVWKTISDPSIPDDNHEATISSYYETDGTELDLQKISYLGNGRFSIPFKAALTVDAIYYIFKSDYYSLDEEHEFVPSVTDHNDHYFEAESDFAVEVTGIATISINRDNINFEDFTESVIYDSLKIDSIEDITLID